MRLTGGWKSSLAGAKQAGVCFLLFMFIFLLFGKNVDKFVDLFFVFYGKALKQFQIILFHNTASYILKRQINVKNILIR